MANSKKIALFNHKGGVSKTTTTFNLGWMLAEKGHRTILVDADPQCNLTGMLLGYMGPSELERFYKRHPDRNIKAALAPAFESRPKLLEFVECVPVRHRPELFLLPGHIGFAEYEVTLGIAQELSGSIQTLQNLPGSLSYLLQKTAAHFDAEYVLIDMSPSLSSINQNLLTTSDFFLVPTNPDFFSVMAIDSLATILPKWNSWSQKAASLPILKEATYPMPAANTKFLGTIIQKFRPRAGAPASGFQHWIDQLEESVKTKLIPALSDAGMTLSRRRYENVEMVDDLWLAVISDFNTLIAKSQKWKTPVFALTAKQLGQQGIVLKGTKQARDAFWEVFSELADRVIGLTRHAGSN
jgi:cellulose biosynthesis protein BcsQ